MENRRNCTQCSESRCSQDDCNKWVIAMAYVPWQNMNQVYEPARALRAGTLFPELEKPFYGSMRKGARR
ncbi:MAG: spore coat associated protein CotJA [Agathobacter sp.]|nr:spore coat associated protein CotJA [Agathobacter sp.]